MAATAIALLNPLTLAFVGDGVFELLARRYIVHRYGGLSPKALHAHTVCLVCAKAQAKGLSIIEGHLRPLEADICRRGRNASGVSVPKSATAADYRRATALEALFGWLELNNETARMHALFDLIADGIFSAAPLPAGALSPLPQSTDNRV